jgi:hypothetical protein
MGLGQHQSKQHGGLRPLKETVAYLQGLGGCAKNRQSESIPFRHQEGEDGDAVTYLTPLFCGYMQTGEWAPPGSWMLFAKICCTKGR